MLLVIGVMNLVIGVVNSFNGTSLGSMLTPVGNPQNLYLYSRYDLSIKTMAALVTGRPVK